MTLEWSRLLLGLGYDLQGAGTHAPSYLHSLQSFTTLPPSFSHSDFVCSLSHFPFSWPFSWQQYTFSAFAGFVDFSWAIVKGGTAAKASKARTRNNLFINTSVWGNIDPERNSWGLNGTISRWCRVSTGNIQERLMIYRLLNSTISICSSLHQRIECW